MSEVEESKYSAGEQYLGYAYQARFALLRLLSLPEDQAVLIEKDDDLDFVESSGRRTLASLKHRAEGNRLTDLSADFWRSTRVWLSRYAEEGKVECKLRFFLFTTSTVGDDTFLRMLLPSDEPIDRSVVCRADDVLSRTQSQFVGPIKATFDSLSEDEKWDFLCRVTIFHNGLRITEVPGRIMSQHMRTVRPDFRRPVLERLEGWWDNTVIEVLAGERRREIFGYEVSDALAKICDGFRNDNLPIDFRGARPDEVDIDGDDRLFVRQLRAIDVRANRIQNAILDYYRAFEQRSAWTRENLLSEGEMEEYEERLVNEWERYRDAVLEGVPNEASEEELLAAGKAIYEWAELRTDYLRIRERVSEPYVVRGNYHILANQQPAPRVYWHPQFLERLRGILVEAQSETLE